MLRFNFRCPTKVFFGSSCVNKHSNEFSSLGKKALIVTGGNSSKKNGSLDDVQNALKKEGISYQLFDEVEQNPTLATVYQAAQQAKDFGAEFIIGIGGGSPMDAAKAVAVLAVNNLSEEDLMARRWTNRPLPVAALPTTAGTGSEVTPYAVLTVPWAETKMSIGGDDLFPALALMDARYMIDMPWEVTVNTAVDALSHSIEGFINTEASVYSDLLARESIAIIGSVLQNIEAENITLAEREELLYASMLAGIVIAQTGTNFIHALGYPLTYFKGLPHGLANGVLMQASLELMAEGSPEKVDQILAAVGCDSTAEVGSLLNKLLPKVNIKLTAEEQKLYAQKTLQTKNMAKCPHRPNEADILRIFEKSNLV